MDHLTPGKTKSKIYMWPLQSKQYPFCDTRNTYCHRSAAFKGEVSKGGLSVIVILNPCNKEMLKDHKWNDKTKYRLYTNVKSVETSSVMDNRLIID